MPIAGPRISLALVAAAALAGSALAQPDGASPPGLAHPDLWPAAHSIGLVDAKTEAEITALMARMSVEEKVGQMIQGDTSNIKPDDLRQYPLGSILSGGDSPPLNGIDRSPAPAWAETERAFRAVSLERRPGHVPIPIIYGVDVVHGNNNVVGATIFPHNIGLGAMRDPELMRRIGQATAEETAASGIDWAFGPTVAVVRDVRWGRTYEGYSDNPDLVASYAGEIVTGLQGPPSSWPALQSGHVAATAKHFLGDGGTLNGHDQGDNVSTEAQLIRLTAPPYVAAIDAGVMSVMVSFSSWQGMKMTGNKSLVTGVLKGRMGFEGFVVSDWNAQSQVPGCTKESCAAAFNAGIDMMMAADSWKGLYRNTLAQVRSGEIPMSRVDDAVRRILRVKFKLGLFGPRSWEGRFDVIGSPAHRAVAREAVRESLVLLKNNGRVLPVRASAHILVAGDGADDIGKQTGGWTLSWQGTGNTNSDFPGATSIYAGIREAVEQAGGTAELSPNGSFSRRPDVAIVVFGEDPYAEFRGDRPTVEYKPGDTRDLDLLRRLKAQGIPVVSVFLSGRPLWVNPELNASDAFVAAWLPGTEGEGIADVLVGDAQGRPRYDFRGKLSYPWPRSGAQAPLNPGEPGYDPLFAYGYGLTYRDDIALPRLSEVSGVTTTALDTDDYFVGGRLIAPWRFVLHDSAGNVPADAAPVRSASGVLSFAPTDAGEVQEAGRALSWSGAGQATVAVAGPPIDLSRQANGDMALLVRYRVDRPPSGRVEISQACGPSCVGSLDFTPVLRAAAPGEWRTIKVKLSCFRDAGADETHIAAPFALTTSSQLGLSIAELRLASNQNDAVCLPK